MHQTAFENCQHFFDCYGNHITHINPKAKVIEIGSRIVEGSVINGTIRSTAPKSFEYIGLDFEQGNGVDVLLEDPYLLPFGDASVDVVLSSSCFEHSEMFWLVYLEIMRVLKPTGLFYMNAPSNGYFHRFPIDAWRFFPDAGTALITWGRRNNLNNTLLESYTTYQREAVWSDFCAIYLKDEDFADVYPTRVITSGKIQFYNGILRGNNTFLHYSRMPEDLLKIDTTQKILSNKLKLNVGGE
jgi:SAM-dependent methyltransferase